MKAAGVSLPWETFHAPLELRNWAYEELGQKSVENQILPVPGVCQNWIVKL
jgi:hypothetical protein